MQEFRLDQHGTQRLYVHIQAYLTDQLSLVNYGITPISVPWCSPTYLVLSSTFASYITLHF